MFDLALSLGYPHPDHLLADLTAVQYLELMQFLNRKHASTHKAKVAKSESTIEAYLNAYERKNHA